MPSHAVEPDPLDDAPRGRGVPWAFAGVFTLVLLGQLATVWVTAIKPLPDLGFHLAAASVLRHMGEPGNRFAEFYEVDAQPKPNTFNLIWNTWPLFPGVLTANQWFYSVYVLAVPLLVGLILRAIGASAWYALLSVPLIYNYSVAYGFAEFTAAIPLCLWLWYAVIRWEASDTWPRAAAAGGLLVLVYLSHAMVAVFALMFFVAFIGWHHRGRWRKMAGRALWMLPAMALLARWYVNRPRGNIHTFGWLAHYYKTGYVAGLPQRGWMWVTSSNHTLVGPVAGPVISAVLLGGILVVCAAGALSRGKHGPLRQATRATPDAVWAWLAVSGFVMLFAPPGLPPYWSVYQRFTCFFVLGLVVLAAGWGRRGGPGRERRGQATPRWAIALMILMAVGHTGLWFNHMWGFRREAGDLRQIAQGVDNDRVVGMWISDTRYRGEPEAFNHAGDYLTVLRHAVVVSALYDFPFTPTNRAVGRSRLPNFAQVRDGKQGIGAYVNASGIDQVVVHGPPPDEAPRFDQAFAVTRQAGAWRLYERR